LLTGNTTLEFAMNIELEEVVIQNVTDDALETASGGAQEGAPCGRTFLITWLAPG